jgi:2-isopropylmalate synthase
MEKVKLYDTTLRDGSQAEGISYSVMDKIRIAEELDKIGIAFIEGGWPGSNPKDREFFLRISQSRLKNSKIAAFSMTRRPNISASQDTNLKALLKSNAQVITIVGKTWDFHVIEVLKTTLDENLAMIEDTISFLVKKGFPVFYDAEHFFDAYKANKAYALKTLAAAQNAGAKAICLCDTNGGSLPGEILSLTAEIKNIIGTAGVDLGIHCHNDAGLAIANSLAAVEAGANIVQGTING